MKTKLSESYLRKACKEAGLEPTGANMALAAFLNDPAFRERVTRFYFEKSMRDLRSEAE